MTYSLLRPLLFRLDPEFAHRLAITMLRWSPLRSPPLLGGPLAVTLAGINFPNPLGLAAGFDKDGEVPDALLGLGFGHVEIGSITPLPQSGNPKPRLFRLIEDRAIINRMGFNNHGAEAALKRLAERSRSKPGVLGINIGANKDSPDRLGDYEAMAEWMAPFASYLTLNVSSPNTPGLRALQDHVVLADLIDRVVSARDGVAWRPPLFLKLAPDLEAADIDAIARLALDKRLDALIISNTTISRPALLSRQAGEVGGLSGAPLKSLALQRLKDFRTATGGAIPLIGVGGIANADDAWQRIRAGASLIQIYSAMVYEGPGIARAITRGIVQRMERDGFSCIADAIGAG